MVDYTRALKRPFQDFGILAIGIVVSIIPIVNFLAFGYFVNIAGETLNKKYGMPKWDDWGNLFVKGLITVIMTIVYMIPAIVIMFVGAGSVIASGFAGMLTNPAAAMSGLAGMGIFFLVGILLAIIGAMLFPIGLIGYAKSGKIDAFFDFKTITKKAFRGSYIIAWAVMMVLSIIVSIVLSMIPVVGSSVGGFIMGVATYTALTEAYLE